MKKMYEIRIGRFSAYVPASDIEQAEANCDGILNEMFEGCEIYVTGSVLEDTVDNTDEAVADMLRGSGGLH